MCFCSQVTPPTRLSVTQQVRNIPMRVYNLHYLRLCLVDFYSRTSTGYLLICLHNQSNTMTPPSKNHKNPKYTIAYIIPHHINNDSTVHFAQFSIVLLWWRRRESNSRLNCYPNRSTVSRIFSKNLFQRFKPSLFSFFP